MTLSRRALIALFVFAPVVWTVSSFAARAAQGALPARSDNAGGVNVVIKPKAVAPGAAWTFDVIMDTHVKPLDTDLAKSAVLVVSGARLTPTSWQGDGPGGHHRKGVLSFPAPNGPATSFIVELFGVGGVATRTFNWTAQ
jgi:hypothetical protein